MTGDGLASYTAAIAALRMLAVIGGEALPRALEPIDIVLLAALRR